MDNEKVVREFIEAWSRLDPDELVDYFTEDGVYHNMPMAPVSGHDTLRQFIRGFLKDWTLVQIEGEEPVEVSAEEPVKGGKKGAAPAKGAPKAAAALEEITDNRPRII